MDHLRKQAARFGARFEQTLLSSVDFFGTPHRLICDGREIAARAVIVATGASQRVAGWPD